MISLPSYHQNISYSYHIYKQKHQQSLIFKEAKNLNQYLKERPWTISSNIITDAEKGKQNPLAREGARGVLYVDRSYLAEGVAALQSTLLRIFIRT